LYYIKKMTHKIFKYELPVLEKVSILLPKGANIIRCDSVEGKCWLWAIVNIDDLETEERIFELYKTGMPIETDINTLKYIGMCKLFIMQELGLYVFENISGLKNELR
jgi:hypothetical protein